MLIALIVTILLIALLLYGLRPSHDQLIVRHPYNNLYNDASGAREDRS